MNPDKKAEFKRTMEDMFEEFMEFDPTWATYFGIHKYDSLMPDGSKASLEDWKNTLKSYKERLENFRGADLDSISIDLKLARDIIDLELFDLEEWKIWSKFPEGPVKVGDGLFLLLARDYPPAEKRMKSLSERINRSVQFLEGIKERLEDPVKIYCKIALESTRRLPHFLSYILEEAKKHLRNRELNLLKKRIRRLEEKLEDYESWLEYKMQDARKDFAIGHEMLERRLELRGIEMDIDSILKLGQEYLQKEKKKLNRLARKIDANKSVEEITQELKKNHPRSFSGALEEYRREISRARYFVEKQDFASLPQNEELRVQKTPHFLRHVTPFAAYFRPAKFDENQVGIYMVTPPEDEGMMKEHNYYSISNTSIHEAYPGHHLQLTIANQHPSLIRLLSEGTEFVEGWAHYCEEAVKDLGYNDTPQHRFLQTLDLVWRAARIIVDIRLSCGEMSFEEAVNFLVEQTEMEREGAKAEVKRYTYTPGEPLSYLLGKHLIGKLREKTEEKLGDDFELKWFHDRMLKNGVIPIKYLRVILKEKVNQRLIQTGKKSYPDNI